MSVGRRSLVLSVTFALLALGLCRAPRANAQQPPFHPPFRPNGFPNHGPGRHDIWQPHLTADQFRQLFGQFDQGDDGASQEIEDLVRKAVLREKPDADPKRIDAELKRMMADKELMARAMDLVQKHKNNPNRDPDAKINPRDFEHDFAKLKDRMTRDGRGDLFKTPPFDPDTLPKFDPKNFDPKNFDPKDFPHADPKNPPQIDPDSGLPLDPRTGRPFDPRTGRPLDPRTGEPPEPKTDPKTIDPNERPKVNPEVPPKIGENPPKIDPNTGRPAEPKEPEPEPEFDPDRPQPPKDSPENLAKQKAYETATALWEKNVGPIDQTPAVKQAIYDLITDREAMDALTDAKGNSLFDMFKDGASGDGLKDLFGGMDGKWEWPKLDWKLDFGKNSNIDFPDARPKTRWPDTRGSRLPEWGDGDWGGWGTFRFGEMVFPRLLLVLLLAVVIAVVVWWKWDAIGQLRSRRGLARPDGLGPWPLDPHEINTREDVVKAFEYLSVLICGPGAKVWTHSTVADELAVLARTHTDAALKLARLYELARYAPLDEPLTRAELFEARRLVCDLAGVD